MELYGVFVVGTLLALAVSLPAVFIRNHLAARLREAEQRSAAWRRSLEAELPDALLTIDEAGVIQSFNPAAEKLFGYSSEEALGESISLLIPATSSTTSGYGLNSLHAARKTPDGIGLEVTGQAKGGKPLLLDLRISEVRDGDRRLFRLLARDLSWQREAEQSIQELKFLEALLHSIPAPMLVLDHEGAVVRLNRAFEEFSGYRAGEVLGRYYWELVTPGEENWARQKVEIGQLIAAGTLRQGEILWKNKADETRPVHLVIAPLQMASAPAAHAIVIGFPLSEQRADRATQPSGLEAVERLASGIANQFNELLTSINGYSELVLHTLDAKDPLRRDIEEIRKAGERAAALTSQLLAFSGKQPLRPSVFNLNELIKQMKPMLEMLAGPKIRLTTALDPDLGLVQADQRWIEQTVLNLAVNARDAMPEGGELTLATANVRLSEAEAGRTVQLPPGDYVALTVRDTGCGMDAEQQAHVFEPFFTTKRSKQAPGLGLSAVYGIVRSSAGGVTVESAPGCGASVRIYLPRFKESRAAEKPARGLHLVRGAGA